MTGKTPRTFRGDRFKFIRQQMKLSQDEMERLLGFGQGVVSRYENGQADPMPNQLAEMARKLQVTIDWLLGVSDDPESVKPVTTAEIETRKRSLYEDSLVERYRSGELEELIAELASELVQKKSQSKKDTVNGVA